MRGLAARIAEDPSATALLGCNLLAVAFAVFHPPITLSVMFLYWAESVVIGAFNVAKICYLPPPLDDGVQLEALTGPQRLFVRSFTPALFVLHYGGFVFICFLMLYSLAGYELRKHGMQQFDFLAYYRGFLWPVLILAVGHGISFYRNFLGKSEFEGRTSQDQMFRPYPRVLLMCVVIFAGCGLVIITGLPTAAVLIFVPFKLLADLRAHFREHAVPETAPTDPRT